MGKMKDMQILFDRVSELNLRVVELDRRVSKLNGDLHIHLAKHHTDEKERKSKEFAPTIKWEDL